MTRQLEPPAGDSQRSEFVVLRDNPQTRAMGLFFLMPSGIGLVLSAALLLANVIDWEAALFAAVFCLLLAAAGIWNAQRVSRGHARLDSSSLVVQTHGWTHSYRWADIQSVRTISYAEAGRANLLWARILRWPECEPFVELTLRRPLRVGLWPQHYGTRLVGIPLLSGKRVPLFLEDPEGFIRTAKQYLDSQED